MKKTHIGMIGLAVMGENLVMNMASKGFTVSAFDIDEKRVTEFSSGRAKGKSIQTYTVLKDFVDSIEKPRKIMMMIRAGSPVDQVIEQLIPLVDQGDIIIDGGNSNYQDSTRRTEYLKTKGIHFIGSGVSGGEEGALKGPSIMPGGSPEAWEPIKPIFQAIAADVNGDKCCEWIGENGAGHFVKMVHNGIEYGDIQLITEAYHLMRDLLQLSHDDMAEIFKAWNKTELDSYLIEITGEILAVKDEDGSPLVTKILDKAGQKGTGKWTAITSLEENVALTMITEAVYARIISSQKDERVEAEKAYPKIIKPYVGNKLSFIEDIRKALYAAKIISYAQGYDLMKAAAKTYHWNLNYSGIAKIWRGGCIIRSAFLNNIKEAYDNNSELSNLIMDDYFKNQMKNLLDSWRKVVGTAVLNGIPTPAMSSALSYFDSYTTASLPANLLQAQRDYFGAHTYERVDQPQGKFFHTNWTGRGGDTSSTTYNT
jgi:6-phosphogluconate dehydrogenase